MPPPLTDRGQWWVGFIIGWLIVLFLAGLMLLGSRLTGGH